VPGGFFIFRDFNISEISLIVNSIIANFEFVLNSNLGGLQLEKHLKEWFSSMYLIIF
jgi:PIN domain nuclease of toxin-antitoxin system